MFVGFGMVSDQAQEWSEAMVRRMWFPHVSSGLLVIYRLRPPSKTMAGRKCPPSKLAVLGTKQKHVRVSALLSASRCLKRFTVASAPSQVWEKPHQGSSQGGTRGTTRAGAARRARATREARVSWQRRWFVIGPGHQLVRCHLDSGCFAGF